MDFWNLNFDCFELKFIGFTLEGALSDFKMEVLQLKSRYSDLENSFFEIKRCTFQMKNKIFRYGNQNFHIKIKVHGEVAD